MTGPRAGLLSSSGSTLSTGKRPVSPPPPFPASRSVSARGSVCGVNRSVSEADHSPHLVPRLRMSGAVPQLHHMPSWCAQAQLYVMFVYCERGENAEAHICELSNSGRSYRMDRRVIWESGDRLAAKIRYWKPNAVFTLSCYRCTVMTVLLAACYCTALHCPELLFFVSLYCRSFFCTVSLSVCFPPGIIVILSDVKNHYV